MDLTNKQVKELGEVDTGKVMEDMDKVTTRLSDEEEFESFLVDFIRAAYNGFHDYPFYFTNTRWLLWSEERERWEGCYLGAGILGFAEGDLDKRSIQRYQLNGHASFDSTTLVDCPQVGTHRLSTALGGAVHEALVGSSGQRDWFHRSSYAVSQLKLH